MPQELLWPDDVQLETSRDGILGMTEGSRQYLVTRSLLAGYPDLLREHRSAITAYIMDNAGDDPAVLSTYNFDEIIRRRPPTVKQKLDMLLRALASATDFQVKDLKLSIGLDDRFTNSLMRKARLNDPQELRSLLIHLSSQGLIDHSMTFSNQTVSTTVPGLVHVEEQDSPVEEARTGFVAMWFDATMTEAYEVGVVPAITASGFEALRIDSREHNNKIDDEIISQIRRALFVVADFSCGDDGPRGGVYFEAGYALALGKPVIWCVRRPDLNKVHFDTRQFNHIIWDNAVDLFAQLKNRIGATIPRP